MIVKCPNCATKYNLPDDKIREGATLKCTVCEHLFPLTLGEPESMQDRFSMDDEDDLFSGMETESAGGEAAGETATQDFDADVDEMSLDETASQKFGDNLFSEAAEAAGAADMVDDFSESGDSGLAAGDLLGKGAGGLGDDFFDSQPDTAPSVSEGSVPEGISLADESLNDDFLQDLSGGSDEPMSFNLDDMSGTGPRRRGRRPGRAPVRKEKSKAPAVILMLLLLIGICGGVAYYLYPDLVARYLPFLAGGEETDAGDQGNATIDKEAVRNIGLENVRQYYMENDKLGPVCIIDGAVVNNFSTPKELIEIRASLLGPAGEVLVEKTQKCGVTLTQFELSVFTEEQIEEALNAKVSILMANTNVRPGDSVDFMVVFADPPENVSEYVVKVVGAENPPEKEPE